MHSLSASLAGNSFHDPALPHLWPVTPKCPLPSKHVMWFHAPMSSPHTVPTAWKTSPFSHHLTSLFFLQNKLKRQFPCDISYSTQALPSLGFPRAHPPSPQHTDHRALGWPIFMISLSGPEPQGVPRTQCRQHRGLAQSPPPGGV